MSGSGFADVLADDHAADGRGLGLLDFVHFVLALDVFLDVVVALDDDLELLVALEQEVLLLREDLVLHGGDLLVVLRDELVALGVDFLLLLEAELVLVLLLEAAHLLLEVLGLHVLAL